MTYIYRKYPVGYYVYAYIRSRDSKNGPTGSPYYIGKGIYNRAWSKHRVPIPKESWRIVIVAENLTDFGAQCLERRLIKWYGRIDIKTGILHNLTDGGDGSPGGKNPQKGRKGSLNGMYGRSHSDAVKKAQSIRAKGNKGCSGMIRIYNLNTKKCQYIHPWEDIPFGFAKGMPPRAPKVKIYNQVTKETKMWPKNIEIPSGWVRGIPDTVYSNKGKTWIIEISSGIIKGHLKDSPFPEGWTTIKEYNKLSKGFRN